MIIKILLELDNMGNNVPPNAGWLGMAPHWKENHLLGLLRPTVLLEVSCGEKEGFKVRNLVADGSCPTCIKEQVPLSMF